MNAALALGVAVFHTSQLFCATATFRPANKVELKRAVKLWWHGPEDEAVARYGHISSWDTSMVIDMSELFAGIVEFSGSIACWDTSNVTNMSGMFTEAWSFNQDIGNWNTSSVTDMSRMFERAYSFNQALDGWSTAR
eukprot:3702432-Amphidinium_carterae.1